MMMRRTRINRTASVAIAALAATLTLSAAPRQAASARPYFPARGEWRKVEPAAAGFDKAELDERLTAIQGELAAIREELRAIRGPAGGPAGTEPPSDTR